MGVPKFFRFISERYPLINTSLPAHPPQIDNLYLDMNGIIHNCIRSSPGNGASDTKRYASIPTAARQPRDIYLDVFKYIDNLVSLLTPRKLLYLAVDGVAPRAKMNQQRARRFRSGKERADEHARRLLEDPLYAAARVDPFDSNCITPGTLFMHNLTEALRYYVARKVTEDNAWSSIQVVLSGPDAPGEGEHKIMEYIRAVRESGQLSPNTRHCVYGLDADLIMLALVTHEPHFFIFREKVDFSAFWKRKSGPRIATALDLASFGEFDLLSVGVLREYITLELGADGNSDLPFFDVERLMDDFVFILMLIGNDFLPNLPTLDIADGTLSVMLHLYKRILPLMGGYLTHEGTIAPLRFEYFLSKLALLEEEVLEHRQEQSSSVGSRSRRRGQPFSLTPVDLDDVFSLYPPGEEGLPASLTDADMRVEISSCRAILTQNMSLGSLKHNYYSSKFGRDFVRDGVVTDLASSYVEGISWTLKYYAEGCRRWHWFYPFHYAPLASDILDVSEVLSRCEPLGLSDEPFQPWQQLLSVLPPSSAWCLPRPYRPLMILPTSPIREYYPESFETDLNGKRNDWEAVVLLPFVDEERLIAACDSVPDSELTQEDVKCNALGPPILYQYSNSHTRTVPSPFGPRLSAFASKAVAEPLVLPNIPVGKAFASQVLTGTTSPSASDELQDLPSLAEQNFATFLQGVGVNVFGMPSKSDSLVLQMRFDEDASASPSEPGNYDKNSLSLIDAKGISVGTTIWFGFPWRKAGLVTSIADSTVTRAQFAASQTRSSRSYISTPRVEARSTVASDFERNVSVLVSSLLQKHAISINKPSQIITVQADEQSSSASDENDDVSVILQPPQFIQPRVTTGPPASVDKTSKRNSDSIVKGQVVMYIGHGAYFGHKCTVVSTAGGGAQIRIRFNRAVGAAREPPFAYRVVSYLGTQKWYTLSRLSQEVGLSPYIVTMFLGSFRARITEREEVDIGLGIKYIARGLHIPGYARRDDRMHFVFSDRCANMIKKYRSAFPFLFESVERMKREEGRTGSRGKAGTVIDARELLKIGKRAGDALNAVAAWLSVQEVAEQPLISTSAEVLPEDIVHELERHCKVSSALQAEYEASLFGADAMKVTKDVPRSMVVTGSEGLDWKWNDTGSSGTPPFHEPVPMNGLGLRIGDRVVNRLGCGSVPFALRGTVVGIHPPELNSNGKPSSGDLKTGSATLVEVLFDETFIGGGSLGGRCSEGLGKAVPAHSLYIIRPERDNTYYTKHYVRVSRNITRSLEQSKGAEVEQMRKDAIGEAAVQKFVSVISPQAGNKDEFNEERGHGDSMDEIDKASVSDRPSDKSDSWDGADNLERSRHSAESDEQDRVEIGDQVVMEVCSDGSVTRVEKGPDGVKRSVIVGEAPKTSTSRMRGLSLREGESNRSPNPSSPHKIPHSSNADAPILEGDANGEEIVDVHNDGIVVNHHRPPHNITVLDTKSVKESFERTRPTSDTNVPCSRAIPVSRWTGRDSPHSFRGVRNEGAEKPPGSDVDVHGKGNTRRTDLRKTKSERRDKNDKDERKRFAKFVAETVKKQLDRDIEHPSGVMEESDLSGTPEKGRKEREGRRGRSWRDESVLAKDEDEDVALWRRLQNEARSKGGNLHKKFAT